MELVGQALAALVAVGLALFAFGVGGRKLDRRTTPRGPPPAVEAQVQMARDMAATIAERDRLLVEDALTSGDPAAALARLANQRRKR
jgi:hypothetical protein